MPSTRQAELLQSPAGRSRTGSWFPCATRPPLHLYAPVLSLAEQSWLRNFRAQKIPAEGDKGRPEVKQREARASSVLSPGPPSLHPEARSPRLPRPSAAGPGLPGSSPTLAQPCLAGRPGGVPECERWLWSLLRKGLGGGQARCRVEGTRQGHTPQSCCWQAAASASSVLHNK